MIDEAEVVKALRKINHMTLRDVADRSGVSFASISNIEHGRHKVSMYVFQRVLEAFDLELMIVKKGTVK